nr:Gag-Pol polyprotein [Tanacetum cinerariifolium]
MKNVIGDPSRFVSTKKQLQTDAMRCYFDAFLTSVEPKNFKQAMTESSWIDAMQEEIHEFERLQVWELVQCPDKVMLMKLKWVYKVKTDEFSGDKTGLGYKATSPVVEGFVNSSEILEKQENRSDKGYHVVPPPLIRNYMPLKCDQRLIDEHIESVSVDVISNITPSDVKTVNTIDVNHKGVFSIEEPKPVMKNSFSPPIIED